MLRETLDIVTHLYKRFGLVSLDPRFWVPVLQYASGMKSLPTLPHIPKQSLSFPADHTAHDATIEWWYLNGFVQTEDGRMFAVHSVLFVIRSQRLGLSGLLGQDKQVATQFSSLLDLSHKHIKKQVGILSSTPHVFDGRVFSFQTPLFQLCFAPTTPLLICGDGYVSFPLDPMFYYSLPQTQLTGDIVLDDQRVTVKGIGWFDHQWGNRLFQHYQWIWMCVSLSEGYQLVVCQVGADTTRTFLTLQFPDGHVTTVYNVHFESGKTSWTSVRSKRTYVVDWHVVAPELQLDLSIQALPIDCEHSLGYVHYFESPTTVTARMAGTELHGQGFLEITSSAN